MTPDRWRRIDDLLQTALEYSPIERAAYLDEVCADETLREEIEALLSFHEQADGFITRPAIETAAELFCEDRIEEMVGLLIGPYKIESPLGTGGMGEVYLAEDTKLGRKVAIKFLPTHLEADELAQRRLLKEARAAAKLDHPNICTIHEVVEVANNSFIVMQYVHGETLASRLQRGPLSLSESLDVSAQVADALEEAHTHGIIHRDVKPQNIMISSRSQVKVLDFGLAIVVRSAGTQTETQSQLSSPGIIAGTAPYMSPEQARGDSVDARSDLFSLGAVLYECVAGVVPFSGATPMDTCAQVINVDPRPPSQVNPQVPPELDAIILKALAKDPVARYESAADLRDVLRTTRSVLKKMQPVSAPQLADRFTRLAQKAQTGLAGVVRRPGVLIPSVSIALAIVFLAYFKGVPSWHTASQQPSADALRWFNIGTSALRNGSYYDASLALQKSAAADDRFPLAHAQLAEAWMELGYADKANQELLRARSLIPDLSSLPPRDKLYFQAITHMVLREFAPAVENYQQLVGVAPEAEKASAYVDLGRAFEKNNELEKAIASYREAASLSPSDVAAFLRLGILYSERPQDMDGALDAFQKAEEIYRELRNFEGVGEVCYWRGLLFSDQDKPNEARVQLEKVLEINGTTSNTYQQCRALSVLSNVSAAQGNPLKAREQADHAIEIARANGIDHQVTSGLIWLGHIFLVRGEYSDAGKYYQQGFDAAQRDRDLLNEAWAQRSLGSLRTLQRSTDEALRYLEPARLFFQQGGYRKGLSLTLILIGRAYRDTGDYEAGLRTFNDLLRQGEQANDLSQIALSHEEIGSVLAVQERYPDALANYDESYRINKSLNALINVGYSVMHRGSVLWHLGRYDEARAALGEASSIAVRPGGSYDALLASIHVAAGRMELSESHFRESRARCRQALDLAGTRYKSTAVQARYTLGLGQIRFGAWRAGLVLCEEAVEIAKATGDPQLLADALLVSAEAKLESGQPQQALESAFQAQQSFARFEQRDSEWRAWLIAARAKRLAGEEATAREFASNAAVLVSMLRQRWGPEAFGYYRSRPDVQRLLNQLDQLSNP